MLWHQQAAESDARGGVGGGEVSQALSRCVLKEFAKEAQG